MYDWILSKLVHGLIHEFQSIVFSTNIDRESLIDEHWLHDDGEVISRVVATTIDECFKMIVVLQL